MTRPQGALRPTLDFSAVRAHLHDARAVRTPTALWISIADIPVLLAEIERLHALVRLARGLRADLLAACRATLAAQREGESDPLSYLRDELNAHGKLPDSCLLCCKEARP